MENFTSLVEHHELQLDPSKLDMLLALVQSNEEGQVCYQELIELVSENQMHTHTHTHIIHTTLQRELHETFHVLQHRDKFPHVHPLLLDFRKGYRIDSDRASKLHSGEN